MGSPSQNAEVAEKLDRIGNLYIAANDTWRAKTFLKAAKVVGEVNGSLADIDSVKGIGKSTADVIKQILKTGTCDRLLKLEKEYPPDALSLTAIEGIGPKGAYAMCRTHGVGNLDDLITKLEKSGEDDSLLKLAKLGKAHSAQGRLQRLRVRPLVEKMLESLRSVTGVVQAEAAGSYRRQCETVRDIDVLVQAPITSVSLVKKAFSEFGVLLSAGQKKMRLRHEGSYKDGYGERVDYILYIDLLVVEAKSWGSAICYFTGSKQHNVELREIAASRGFIVNEHGIYKGRVMDEKNRVGGANETDLYDILGLPFVEPKDRDT